MEIDQTAKDRVLAEETYRVEVKKQLEAANAKSHGRVNKFLNSSFGLWVLSAVFISGAGTVYQNWQKDLDAEKVKAQQRITEESANRQAIERLDIEISFRLSQALLQLSTISEQVAAQLKDKTEPEQKLAAASATFGVVQRLASSAVKADREALYPEHASYSLPALMAELRRRLPEADRSKVERSLASLVGLASKANYDLGSSAPLQAAASLHENVVLLRWQRTAFHYIDCNAKQPFC